MSLLSSFSSYSCFYVRSMFYDIRLHVARSFTSICITLSPISIHLSPQSLPQCMRADVAELLLCRTELDELGDVRQRDRVLSHDASLQGTLQSPESRSTQ